MEQNKNKIFFLAIGLLLMLSLPFILSACVPPVPEVIDVTGVDITEEDQSMKVDETLQLTAVVTPEDADNKDITWESDNPDVASVDKNGLVTALKRGTANITVTTDDGAFTDTIKITIIKPTPAPTPTPDKYTLTTEAKPEEGGTTTGDGNYEEGTVVSITATPADGYEFDNWVTLAPGVLADGNSASTTFTMAASDATIWAKFTLKTYEVTLGAVEVNTPPPASFGLTSRLVPNGTILEADIPGVEIEIFTDEARTQSITTITTGQEGIATVNLPAGTYYYTAIADGYVNFLSEIYQYFSETIDIPIAEPGLFVVDGPGENINLFPMLKVWKVSFEAYEYIEPIPAGLSRDIAPDSPLEGVNIDIFEYNISSAGRASARSKIPPLVSITTGPEGTAEAELPNGNYSFIVSKEGYAEYPQNEVLSVTRIGPKNYFYIDGADVTNIPPTFMIHVYNVNIANVVGGTATVTATPDTNVPYLETVTVTINGIETGKAFSSIEVVGNNPATPIAITEEIANTKYSFTMPAEDVTVTVTLEDAGCPQAGYIYNGSAYADNWMLAVSSPAEYIEFSKDGDYLYLKAFQLVDDYKNDQLIGYSTHHDNKAYISKCINSIEINWENTGTDSDHNKSYLFVANSSSGIYDNSDVALLTREGNFNRTTETLDVSGLTSDTYYIGVIAKVLSWGNENNVSEIKVHSIKLSEDMVIPE